MTMTVNGTSPTVILVGDSSTFTVAFPSGSKTATKVAMSNGSTTTYYYSAEFIAQHSYNYKYLRINDIVLTSSYQLVYGPSSGIRYNAYYAKYDGSTLTLRSYRYQVTTASAANTTTITMPVYTGIFSPNIELTVLRTVQNGTTTNVWGKPYALTMTAGTGVSLSCSRETSPNMHWATGSVSAGSNKVAYGDRLAITATPLSGYKISSFIVNGVQQGSFTSAHTTRINVSSAISVSATGEATSKVLSKPVFQQIIFDNDGTGFLEYYILNNNSVDTTLHIMFYDNAGNVYGSDTFTPVPANDGVHERLSVDSTGSFEDGWYLEVYFTADGWTQSETALYET